MHEEFSWGGSGSSGGKISDKEGRKKEAKDYDLSNMRNVVIVSWREFAF
jgi:hypothetical protein